MHLFDITYLITTYGYIGIFLVVFLESGIFFPLPGDSLLFTVGLLAAGGLLSLGISLPVIFIAAALGGFLGYWIGIHIEHLRRYPFFHRILPDKHIGKAHGFFQKYGARAIILSRFVPVVRTFMPIIAGIARMNWKVFAKNNLIGAAVWGILVTLAGYFLGHSFPWIKNYMTPVVAVVVILSLLPAALHFFKKKA